ncbi:PD-(D/E)XK nuclease family protein [Clostridium sp. HMP27]|uniref:PD-(D/E)XK nuclease family protein n=1 Tax=Clostridium sp. HMP27 TaxID=1487921 RepID=UPI00052C61DB|nr:PD-(D/E)XK nuclease family protein [Clostridium sp. HMP27]KGK84831.1 hypothetical protein DP68_16345 [Clostridium sp. HMP27]
MNNKFLAFDKTIHQTMADFNMLSECERGQKKALLNLLRKNWITEGYESPVEEQKFRIRAHNVLATYFYSPLDIGADVFTVNRTLSEKVDKKIFLFSKIDKVYERFDGGIEVVDYKSGYLVKHMSNFPMDLKSAITLKLIYLKLGVYPDFISYYYLTYNRKFTRKISNEDIIDASILIDKVLLKKKNL